MSGSSTCKSCGRPIVWAKTSAGKNIPLDPDPNINGNMLRYATGTDERGRVVFKTRAIRADEIDEMNPRERYLSHFVTCPNAAQHRRKP